MNALCFVTIANQCTHELLVLGSSGELAADFEKSGVTAGYLKPVRNPWRLSMDIREKVMALKPDGIIIWHGMVMLPQMLHALADYNGRILVHGGNPALLMSRMVDWRYLMLEKILGRRACAAYVCCSRHVANSFSKSRYLSGFQAFVVPNGVRRYDGDPYIPRFIASRDMAKVGMLARLDVIKDHDTLLHAFASLLSKRPNTILEIAGDGERKKDLENLAESLGIASHVVFLGEVQNAYETTAGWDVFIYATTEGEGLGNALIEAMMAGVPCIATSVAPIKEMDGGTGSICLVPPADSSALAETALTLISDYDSRVRFSRQGRSRALTAYSQEAFVKGYEKHLFYDDDEDSRMTASTK